MNTVIFGPVDGEVLHTLIIHVDHEADQAFPEYFVVSGDKRHLDNVFINTNQSPELEDELINLLWDDDGNRKLTPLSLDQLRRGQAPGRMAVIQTAA